MTETRPPRTVVGVGASAGGLDALRRLLAHVRDDSELAFVVVVHLSPDHDSHLAELLQPHAALPVQQVNETTALERGHIYVIPPGWNLETDDSKLRLVDAPAGARVRAPIDHFLRSLSESHDGHSVGVVLTGSGSDGAVGLRAVKGVGGLTIVQDPTEAEYDPMPRAAIATGAVDLVLPLDRIVDAIEGFEGTEPRLPAVDDDPELVTRFLPRIVTQIRARLGHELEGPAGSTARW